MSLARTAIRQMGVRTVRNARRLGKSIDSGINRRLVLGSSSISGRLQKGVTIQNLRQATTTVAASRALDDRRIRKAVHDIHKMSSKLQVAERDYEYERQKYKDDPPAFERFAEKFIRRYIRDVTTFLNAYTIFLLSANHSVFSETDFLTLENRELEDLIKQVTEMIGEGKMYAHPKDLMELGQAVDDLKTVEVRVSRKLTDNWFDMKYKAEDIEHGRGHVTSIGWLRYFGGKIIGGRWMVHKMKHLGKAIRQLEFKDMRENLQVLKGEIDAVKKETQEGFSEVFLIRLRFHISNLHLYVVYQQELLHDLYMMERSVQADFKIALDSLSYFLAIFQNNRRGQAALINSAFKSAMQAEAKLRKILEQRGQDEQTVMKQIKLMADNAQHLLKGAAAIAERAIEQVKKDPVDFARRKRRLQARAAENKRAEVGGRRGSGVAEGSIPIIGEKAA